MVSTVWMRKGWSRGVQDEGLGGRNKVRGCGDLWVQIRLFSYQTCFTLRNARFDYFYFYAFGALLYHCPADGKSMELNNAVNNSFGFGVCPPIRGTGVRFSPSCPPHVTRQRVSSQLELKL